MRNVFGIVVFFFFCFLIVTNFFNPKCSRYSQYSNINFANSEFEIEGIDRFQWYLKTFYEDNDHQKLKDASNISLLYAYEFDHEITVTLTTWNLIGFRVFCRYLNVYNQEIGDPIESLTYPEYIVNCPKKNGTKRIGVSVEKNGEFESLPIIDRMMKEPTYELSMCIAPLYGDEPKWLLFSEMIEHYKLQGVQHFYLHIHNASIYDLKIVNDYVRTGELKVHYLLERDQRTDNHWHMVNIADCLIWSRGESKWTIFADLDERILMTEGTILEHMRQISDERVGGIQFRQQWILKTELMPERYEGEEQIDKWLPVRRWHNSTAFGPPGHTSKCIVDTSKVFIMWIHDVTKFYPGQYYLQEIGPEKGIVRHYRDQSLGDWGSKWLSETLDFGPMSYTDYPPRFSRILTEKVKQRTEYVYRNQGD